MRLAITGKTRSGKSTALHCILHHALRHPWHTVVLLDGKGSELAYYAGVPAVRYYDASDIDHWDAVLQAYCTSITDRYRALTARNLRSAPDGDPRWLVVVDEVQAGTRHARHGPAIRNSLTQAAEQSAALGDVLILSTQRAINAVPPSARHNINAWLTMLGEGYYHLAVDGSPTISGRTRNMTPTEALAPTPGPGLPLAPAHLPQILGTQPPANHRAQVTLYLGEPGSGRTWHLHQHKPQTRLRTVCADVHQPHKQVLTEVIEKCGTQAPPRTPIPDLLNMACLALKSEPTLLLLDNIDRATDRTLVSIVRLLEAPAECAMSSKRPETAGEHRRIDPLVPRAKVVEILPLERSTALALARQHLPIDIQQPAAVERRILELANGHPATIVRLATQTTSGTLAELRHYQAPAQQKTFNIGWILLMAMLFAIMFYQYNGYLVAAVTTIAIIVLRRLLIRYMFKN